MVTLAVRLCRKAYRRAGSPEAVNCLVYSGVLWCCALYSRPLTSTRFNTPRKLFVYPRHAH